MSRAASRAELRWARRTTTQSPGWSVDRMGSRAAPCGGRSRYRPPAATGHEPSPGPAYAGSGDHRRVLRPHRRGSPRPGSRESAPRSRSTTSVFSGALCSKLEYTAVGVHSAGEFTLTQLPQVCEAILGLRLDQRDSPAEDGAPTHRVAPQGVAARGLGPVRPSSAGSRPNGSRRRRTRGSCSRSDMLAPGQAVTGRASTARALRLRRCTRGPDPSRRSRSPSSHGPSRSCCRAASAGFP